ncbi:MAG: metal ABC transporter ATP-binding protein [Brevinema sp.]
MSLIVNKLSASYNNQQVLKDISFTLEYGEMLAIIGPNGSGKTTLMRTLLGLKTPDSGSVLLEGKTPIQALKKYRGLAAYLPQSQNINTLLPLSVEDVVSQGFKARKIWDERLSAEEKDAVDEALELVQMKNCKNLLFRSLSGGQRQRVLIALAISGNPRYLFLDEPSNALDFSSIDKLYHLLGELRSVRQMGILIISHDIGAIGGSADRIGLLMNSFRYLGSPQTVPQEILREVFGCHISLMPDDPDCDICRQKSEGTLISIK